MFFWIHFVFVLVLFSIYVLFGFIFRILQLRCSMSRNIVGRGMACVRANLRAFTRCVCGVIAYDTVDIVRFILDMCPARILTMICGYRSDLVGQVIYLCFFGVVFLFFSITGFFRFFFLLSLGLFFCLLCLLYCWI
jgi:hypothetical protein